MNLDHNDLLEAQGKWDEFKICSRCHQALDECKCGVYPPNVLPQKERLVWNQESYQKYLLDVIDAYLAALPEKENHD